MVHHGPKSQGIRSKGVWWWCNWCMVTETVGTITHINFGSLLTTRQYALPYLNVPRDLGRLFEFSRQSVYETIAIWTTTSWPRIERDGRLVCARARLSRALLNHLIHKRHANVTWPIGALQSGRQKWLWMSYAVILWYCGVEWRKDKGGGGQKVLKLLILDHG